ncbi:MAG TPA: hypothetical protein VGN51_08345 [Acidimicrobiia bacterium]|jgi:hypothetical protein
MGVGGKTSSGFARATAVAIGVVVLSIGGVACSGSDSDSNASSSTKAEASTTTPTGAALPENAMLGLDRVTQEFPELTKIGKTGPDETAIDNPMASRAVFYTDESGEKKVTISVSQYKDVAAAKKAWAIAVKASKGAPGGKTGATPKLGEEAFAGTSQVGDEMHYGLGFRDGRLIIAWTYAGLPVSDDNSTKLTTLAGEELTAAKNALGNQAAG